MYIQEMGENGVSSLMLEREDERRPSRKTNIRNNKNFDKGDK